MRHLKVVTVLIVLFVVAACNSQRASTERLGKTNQALLIQGSPCLQNSHCETGFCVDAICCENACGGGERDNFSCSNVYGTVAGLVDGTCTQLQPGDACGKLETFDPCEWRGTKLNGGHNCPNPPFGAQTFSCYNCGGGQTCPDGVPVCVGGECVGCNGDFGDTNATRACPTQASPACVAGACLECSAGNLTACTPAKPICKSNVCVPGCLSSADCSGTTPVCNTTTNQCVPCNGDNTNGGVSAACPTTAEPACLPNGDCVECDADTLTACTAAKPICNTNTNLCVECTTTANCTGVEVCNPTTGECVPACTTNNDCSGTTPVCVFPPGVCVECTVGNATGCPTNEPVCDPTNNTCVGCVTSATCPGDKPICDPVTKTCTATCTVSSQCPGDTPLCNPATKTCVECTANSDCPTNAPICNPATGTCGTTCTENIQCPGDKPICNPVTKVCVECTTNANCIPPEVCDTTTGTCGPCTTSVQCPGDTPICNPATKKCVECTSNANCQPPEVCDTTTGNCTVECTTSVQCPGDTPVCDPATRKCVDCLTNSDCPQGQVCNQSTKKCERPQTGAIPPTGQPTSNPADEFNIQGAGCNCSTTGDDRQSGTPAVLGLGLALTVLARRRQTANRSRGPVAPRVIDRN